MRNASTTASAASAALAALSHPTRLRILVALFDAHDRGEPARLDAMAVAVGLDVRLLSKEIVRLTEAGLITREQGRLAPDPGHLATLSDDLVETTALCRAIPPTSPLRRYLAHGRVTVLPKRPDDLSAVAAALASLLPDDRELTEPEVNAHLAEAGPDTAALRRLLVDLGFLTRQGAAHYRRVIPTHEHTVA
ncbi:DUF2087 domain-containing protein [Actinokineospora enzanensis]|uniref:DUF2087 domain-containing protein n=1 Tax=Actinokineospora enzanensis TaxID=155975 RepID=UPI0003674488|nr:DUF2087 domain-containing protein [Actinokineospora enzanensis]